MNILLHLFFCILHGGADRVQKRRVARVLQNTHRDAADRCHQDSDQTTNRQTLEVYPASDHNIVAGALQICNISILGRTNAWRLLVFVKAMRWFQGTFVVQKPVRRLSPSDSGRAAITPRDF